MWLFLYIAYVDIPSKLILLSTMDFIIHRDEMKSLSRLASRITPCLF
jgi:hypothetical protein